MSPSIPQPAGPLSPERLAEIREAAVQAVKDHPSTTFMAPYESLADAVLAVVLPPVLAEIERLVSEGQRYRTAWRMARTRALSTGGAADRYAARAREGQTALQDMLGALFGAQMERDAAQAEVAALRAVLAGPKPTAADGTTEPDTLPAWLHWRFGPHGQPWSEVPEEDQACWEHQAHAVRRAVARNGFKTEAGAR